MANNFFSVRGYKTSSLYLDDDSFKFSSKKFVSAEDFEESYHETMSLATKFEIRYGRIISIKIGNSNESVVILYKSTFGIPSSFTFSFNDTKDYEVFSNYMENELGLLKIEEKLTPIKAIYNQLFVLSLTFAITAFGYFEAVKQTGGKIEKASTRNEQIFNILVHYLGVNGVLLIGGLVTCLVLFQISKRIMNPPSQLKFIISDF